jgi:putative two-component system hydrogenase maturation factor HypX/HoxX
VLEADGHFDAGAVWASRTFSTRPTGKSSLYRHEVRRAAVGAIVEAMQRIAEPGAAGARFARDPRLDDRLEEKRRVRARDEQVKSLRAYRNEELARSYRCFFGEDRSYHEARHRFVHKLGAPCAVPTPAVEDRPAATGAARG